MPLYYSASFSGSNYLNIANYTGNPAALSVSCWVNLSATQVSRIFFSNFDNASGKGWAVGISDSTNNQVKFYFGSSTLFQSGTLSNATWTHIVFSHDGTTGKIYLNGNTTPSNTLTAGLTYGGTPPSNYLGTLQGLNQLLNGRLAGVGYWSKAVSTTEVASLYNSGSGLAASELSGSLLTSLVSYQDFTNGTNLGFDQSGGGHNYTNTGDVFQAAGVVPVPVVVRPARSKPLQPRLQSRWSSLLAGYALAQYGGTALDLTGRHPGTLAGGMTWGNGPYGPQLQAADNGVSPGCYLDVGTIGLSGTTELTFAALCMRDTDLDAPGAQDIRFLVGGHRFGSSYLQCAIWFSASDGRIYFNSRYNNFPYLNCLAPPAGQWVLITGRILSSGEQSLWYDSTKVASQTLAGYQYATDVGDTCGVGGHVLLPGDNWSGPIAVAYFANRGYPDSDIAFLTGDPFAPGRPPRGNLSPAILRAANPILYAYNPVGIGGGLIGKMGSLVN